LSLNKIIGMKMSYFLDVLSEIISPSDDEVWFAPANNGDLSAFLKPRLKLPILN
jgi:hypothetical protein